MFQYIYRVQDWKLQAVWLVGVTIFKSIKKIVRVYQSQYGHWSSKCDMLIMPLIKNTNELPELLVNFIGK